jgi:hypothetical protein
MGPARLAAVSGKPRKGVAQMPDSDADRFRKMADECREQAERAHSALDKERWLRLAGNWITMAQEADKRDR